MMINPYRFAGLTYHGLDDTDRTGSVNIFSDEANPSTIANGTDNEAAYYAVNGAAISGDFEFLFTLDDLSSNGDNWMAIGVFRSDETGTFSASSSNGGASSMTDSFFVRLRDGANPGFYKAGSLNQAYTFSTGEAAKLVRSGSTISWYVDDVLQHTESSVDTGDMYVIFAHQNGTPDEVKTLSGVQVGIS